jgi:hypothetical protein
MDGEILARLIQARDEAGGFSITTTHLQRNKMKQYKIIFKIFFLHLKFWMLEFWNDNSFLVIKFVYPF